MSSPISIEEFVKRGGKIVHFDEGKRRITAAYCFGRGDDEGTIFYGAAIHRQEAPNDHWNRKDHIRTAISRLITGPVEFFDDVEPLRGKELKKRIRREIGQSGCCRRNQVDYPQTIEKMVLGST
jgi:hypothetical protein